MTLRLPLAKNRFATFVSVYSPTLDSSDDVKDRFYDTLYSALRRISQDDKIILLGDFNARVGRNHDIWHGVIGHHGVGNMNSSGLRLLSLWSELGLAITNTFFNIRDMHKTSWMHPRSKHWHLRLHHCQVPWLEWSANYSCHAWGRVLHWSPPNPFHTTANCQTTIS